MIMNGALRAITPQVARRCYAAAVAHGHGHGKEVSTGEGRWANHPLFKEHPVAPAATYDDWPIPVLPYKEGYEKHQKPMNQMLIASVVTFTAMLIYFWKNDVLGLSKGRPPKWYTHRKIGKGLGDID